jgi:hypothetical protein
MTILDQGWTEERVKGLLDVLNLVGGMPDWNPEHLEKLRDWCSAHEKNPTRVEAQLEFISYELCNSHEGVGSALKLAKNVNEARTAVEPFVKLLSASEKLMGTAAAPIKKT